MVGSDRDEQVRIRWEGGDETSLVPDEARKAVLRHEKHTDRVARTAAHPTKTGDTRGDPKITAKRSRESTPWTDRQQPSAAASGQNDPLDAVIWTMERTVLAGEAQHRKTPPPPLPRGMQALIAAYTKGTQGAM